MRNKLIQYTLILLVLTAIVGSYFYFRSEGSTKVNSSQETKLTDGLVGYWTFDGSDMTATQALDSAGSNDGTLTGTTRTIGKIGQALDFDGIDDYVDMGFPSLGINTAITMCAWINSKDVSNSQNIVQYRDTEDQDAFVFRIHSGGNLKVGDGNGVLITSITTLLANTWYHTCFVASNLTTGEGTDDNFDIYLNGVVDASSTIYYQAAYGPGSDSLIGVKDDSGYDQYFNGSIDEVRIYNRALSQDEISELYSQGQVKINASQETKLTDGLVGNWTFDGQDTTSTTAMDKSPIGTRHGTLAGAAGSQNKPQPNIGKIGQALNFDGTDDDVATSTWTAGFSPPMTYGAWFKLNAAPTSDMYVLSKSGEFNMRINATRILCHEDNSGQAGVVKTITLNAGQWYHIMCVINQQGIGVTGNDIYIDGADSNAISSGFAPSSYGDSFHIGTGQFNGKIDEVRVYNRGLSASEISELYNQGQTKINASQETKLTDGLVGNWTFDGNHMDWSQSTAEVRDQVGSNHGDVQADTMATPGKVGQALYFDGTDDCVDLGNASSLNFNYDDDFSTSAWVKKDTSTWQAYLSKWNNSVGTGWHVRFDNDDTIQLRLQYADLTRRVVKTSSAYGTTDWQHIVTTSDGINAAGIKIYINGSEVGTTTVEDTIANSIIHVQNGTIGYRNCGGSFNFTGSIDEVRTYDRVLTSQEVEQLYNMGK